MEISRLTTAGRIQTLAATVLATHPAGHRLCLIGGFRYRLLNASARASNDIGYQAVAANLRAAGGAAMVWDTVMRLLRDALTGSEELSS